MIDVCLLGTGGMMPLPERFLTSLYLRTDGRALMIDCGEGTQTAVRMAGMRFKKVEALLITHFHADHISGLPGLLLTLGNEERDEPLHIYGPAGLKKVVSCLRVIVPELPYEIICHELPDEGGTFEAAGLNVTAFPADHGMVCFGYCVTLPRPGKFDPEKAKRNGVPMKFWGKLQDGFSLEGYTPEDVLGEPRKGLKLLYCTDSRPVEDIVALGQGADLLILEGMFGGNEKDERARFTHHCTMNEAAALAARANAKRLWLTHFSPANPHPEEFEEEIKGIFENTVIPADGMTETLKFEE